MTNEKEEDTKSPTPRIKMGYKDVSRTPKIFGFT